MIDISKTKKKKMGTDEERNIIIKLLIKEVTGIDIEVDDKIEYTYSKFNYMELCNPLIMAYTYKGMNHLQIANKLNISERRVKYVKYEI